MTWLGLLLMFNTASAECSLRTTTRDLAQGISDVEAAFVSMDINAFNEAETRTLASIDCLEEALTPYDAAGFHRMSALRSFIVRDEESAKASYVAALTSQPNYNLPESLAPKGKSLDSLYTEARVLAEEKADRVAVEIPNGAIMTVDGRREQMRPISRPSLIQLLDLKGVVLWSGYIEKDGMDPDFTGVVVEAPADTSQASPVIQDSKERKGSMDFRISGTNSPRNAGFSAEDKPKLIASAASTATAIVLYGLAASVAAKHAAITTNYQELDSLQKRNHRLIIASGLAGGFGIGLGAVIYFN
ncbi:MAG: hypothetical protein VX519_09005 [Myxococcota bacterium]|nr:hypothetical protein [Myxococcota bacterium]